LNFLHRAGERLHLRDDLSSERAEEKMELIRPIWSREGGLRQMDLEEAAETIIHKNSNFSRAKMRTKHIFQLGTI
jgi:hypothetical protein